MFSRDWLALLPVREAFNEIFPPMTGKQLAEITERIRDLTAKFKMGEESSKNLKNTFKGVFAVLDIVGQAFKAVAGGVGELIGLFFTGWKRSVITYWKFR